MRIKYNERRHYNGLYLIVCRYRPVDKHGGVKSGYKSAHTYPRRYTESGETRGPHS